MKRASIYFLPDRLFCLGKSHEIEERLNQLANEYTTVHELLQAFRQGLEVRPNRQ